MNLKQVGVTLLGRERDHHDSLRAMLEGHVARVAWVPDSYSFRTNRGGNLRRVVSRVLDQLWGTRDQDYLAHVTRTIDESASQYVIAYWGTVPLPDLTAIKKARPRLKIIWMVLCYPLALTGFGIYKQRLLVRRHAHAMDGIMCPAEEMVDYFRAHVLGKSSPPIAVIPPCWPMAYQALDRPAPVGDNPNIIYVGRTDLSGSTIHPADDIRPLMRSILDGGIELHHVYSPETDDSHPNRKPFRPLPLQELIAMMGGYDASLVTANTNAVPRPDRFALTVSDRLITSVTAGVPIAIPARGFEGALSYLRKYRAVIPFESSADLRAALTDRQRVAELRATAWDSRQYYAAEYYGADLRAFLGRI